MDRIIEKKGWINKKYILPGIIAIIVIFFIFKILLSKNESKLNVEEDKITIDEVVSDYFQDYIAVIGTVQPIRTIFLDAIEGGRVEEILIEEGNQVKKGDVILRLSNNNLLLEISNIEAQVSRAINDLKTTRVNLENLLINSKVELLNLHYNILDLERKFNNNKVLFENNHISKEEFQLSNEQYQFAIERMALLKEKYKQDSISMKTRIASGEAQVDRMQKNLTYVMRRLEALEIKAPVNGELATLNPEIGEVINYGA
ncbi:MAG: biotin/lipoyl-binding protein, partial [Bacteroidales bacterium]|nr:biotin/lipoyl-binding protein [Bacteroidales bacterium]